MTRACSKHFCDISGLILQQWNGLLQLLNRRSKRLANASCMIAKFFYAKVFHRKLILYKLVHVACYLFHVNNAMYIPSIGIGHFLLKSIGIGSVGEN